MLKSRSVTPLRRLFSQDLTPSPSIIVKKSGFYRGSLLGFLAGFALAGSTGYVFLLQEYQRSSAEISKKLSLVAGYTLKVKEYNKRVEMLEQQLKTLKDVFATKVQLEGVRREALSVVDGVNMEVLETKTQLYDLVEMTKK